MRGVTIGPIESSQQAGRGYGTEYSARLLDELRKLGVNWIAITPYGRMWDEQSTDILMDFEAPYEDTRAAIAKMVEQAHERDMRVLLVPHIWIEAGGFRLHVDPGSEARWKAFLSSYREFILAWAADSSASRVDAFAIGQECQSFSGSHLEFWTSLIRDVRAIYPGLVTYSANWWEEVSDVLFWDQLDLVGVNAFYELGWQDNTLYENHVKAEEARDELAYISRTLGMPVFFTEIGYMARPNATFQPHVWPEHADGSAVDEAAQTRGFEVMFQYFLPEPWFSGLFIWRYYSNIDDVSQEPITGFSPHAKQAEGFLRDAFQMRWGVDPEAWPWL